MTVIKKALFILVPLSLFFKACGQGPSLLNQKYPVQEQISPVQTNKGDSILTRFGPPKGFSRTTVDSTSFESYLRNLPLKPIGSVVKLYNGQDKSNRSVHAAVIDLPIGQRNLHQCADAIMRLRAEYLFQQKRYKDIHFNFTNGFKADYHTWKGGNRIVVEGNKVYWKKKVQPSTSYVDFWKYLEVVFSYAGTASLSKELTPIVLDNIQIGDIFIQGGFPGHAVIVVDMAKNSETQETMVLLAQSYMPAQEIHILENYNNTDLSPWYAIHDIGFKLDTPEWVFRETDLKRFPN